MLEFIQNLDWSILQWIQENLRCGFLDFLMPRLTVLGNHGEIWILSAVILLCTKKYRKYGIILAVGLLLCLLIGNIWLKPWIARPRPSWLDPEVILLITNPSDYSFPSGHTFSSAVAATILTLTNCRLGFLAIPLACLLAFSRLYLYVHFPSDILAAAVLGVLIGWLTFRLGEKFFDHYEQKKLIPPSE
ncbi:MAG: phosphatase PAP2 family protein [Bacillota bacterium]|jgi:undecaprenyl-diphosphatase